LGRGDGSFQAAVHYDADDAARRPEFVIIADFNQDGSPDLISANYSSLGCSLRFGKGDGTFQEAMSFKGGPPARSVAVADFNQDGQLDVALGGFRCGVLMLLNTCPNAGIKLAVARTNNALTLSWPLPYANFVLESATDLSSRNWQSALGPPTTDNGRCEVTMPLNHGQCFFRLRKP
jgi:hypothetical protein